MTITVTASFGGFRKLSLELDPIPVPPPNRPDEYWWIQWDEGMPLEPARIEFEGDTPAKILQLGDESWGTPLEEVPHIKLVERILPAGRVAEVVAKLQEVHREQSCSWPMQHLDEAIEMLRGEPAKEG